MRTTSSTFRHQASALVRIHDLGRHQATGSDRLLLWLIALRLASAPYLRPLEADFRCVETPHRRPWGSGTSTA